MGKIYERICTAANCNKIIKTVEYPTSLYPSEKQRILFSVSGIDMILNGKIFVSNCDSTRNLTTGEIQHRLLVSIPFAEGIICSPNQLIDNLDALALLKKRTLKRWYNEEGHGSIVVRSPIDLTQSTLTSYFDKLPGDHYFHSMRSTKKRLER